MGSETYVGRSRCSVPDVPIDHGTLLVKIDLLLAEVKCEASGFELDGLHAENCFVESDGSRNAAHRQDDVINCDDGKHVDLAQKFLWGEFESRSYCVTPLYLRIRGNGCVVFPASPVVGECGFPIQVACQGERRRLLDNQQLMAKFKRRLRGWLPTAQTLEQTRGFVWLGHYFREHPRLWVLHRRGVALGVALGIGIGVFPLPLQMPAAMLAAVFLNGNVAAAAAATWLTNPFTMAPIWALAAFLGSFVVRREAPDPTPALDAWQWDAPLTWPSALWEQVVSWGPALLAGFPLAGVVLGTVAYALVYWTWAVLIRQERRHRLARRSKSRSES